MLGWFADPILKVLRSFLVHQLSLSKYPRFPISIKPASMIPYGAKMVRVFFIAQLGCQGPLDGHPSQHWTKPRAGQICPPSWAGPYGVIRGYFFKWDFAWGTWWWTIVNHWFKRCTLSDKPISQWLSHLKSSLEHPQTAQCDWWLVNAEALKAKTGWQI